MRSGISSVRTPILYRVSKPNLHLLSEVKFISGIQAIAWIPTYIANQFKKELHYFLHITIGEYNEK